jgi:hypothetical protein
MKWRKVGGEEMQTSKKKKKKKTFYTSFIIELDKNDNTHKYF